MGWFGSPSVETTQKKTTDNSGTVNNNVVVSGEPVDIFSIELIILVGILVILRIIEFAYFMYRCNQRRLKKKYTSSVFNCNQNKPA